MMRGVLRYLGLCATLTLIGASAARLPIARPDKVVETVLWSACCDAGRIEAPLLRDSSGALYGAAIGPLYPPNNGAVFKLTPSGSGYTFSLLHDFKAMYDGDLPSGPLIADSSGALYGTTSYGGNHFRGTVFKLTPSGSKYRERILYSFDLLNNGGAEPYGGVIADASGALYGTNSMGGKQQFGTVFRITSHRGVYVERLLHTFSGPDGKTPYGTLIMDSSGALYGTTLAGGSHQGGTVFKLTPQGSSYIESVLYSFGSNGNKDGYSPYAGVVADAGGALYGTTEFGGSADRGTVFKLTPSSSGYTESVVHSFEIQDGDRPYGGVFVGPGGVLYGTTSYGGARNAGVVFELTPHGGHYTDTTLWSFGKKGDAVAPWSGLIADSNGSLYGTSTMGGTNGSGAVFKITP